MKLDEFSRAANLNSNNNNINKRDSNELRLHSVYKDKNDKSPDNNLIHLMIVIAHSQFFVFKLSVILFSTKSKHEAQEWGEQIKRL